MSHLSTLFSADLPSETAAVQLKAYVTFSCPPTSSSSSQTISNKNDGDGDDDPTITLLERRHLISGSRTTGFRTWEAALHLGAYLLSPQAADVIRGRNVLELGTGTGFLSILCAKHLQAQHVTATDGDEGVVEALRENFFVNDLDDERKVLTSILRWGRGLKGTWVEEDCEAWPYDVVVGADIVCLDSDSRQTDQVHDDADSLGFSRHTIKPASPPWSPPYAFSSTYDQTYKC